MFGNRMQTSAIPERVYALCREVASKLMDENSLKLLLEPQNLGGKTPYFGIVRTAAEQLKLINTKENTISLAVDKDVIKSMDSMRHYINMHLELVSDSLFYKVTQGYLDMGTEVLNHNSVSKMSDVMGCYIGEKVIEDDMRAWRFWMECTPTFPPQGIKIRRRHHPTEGREPPAGNRIRRRHLVRPTGRRERAITLPPQGR